MKQVWCPPIRILRYLGLAALLLAAAEACRETMAADTIQTAQHELKGTITGDTVSYTVHYLPGRTRMPVLFHHYAKDLTHKTNARIAGYGVFCVAVEQGQDGSHGGYGLQDYKDAIDHVFRRYAAQADPQNVTIMGVSYGGAVTYGMAVRFPYLFDGVIPIFGIADYGYDDEQSWWVMIAQNSPEWGPLSQNMPRHIGDRKTYRDERYLVRNAVFGAKNNPYAHFEILHDVNDGVKRPGVHVEQSRRYVAELRRLGYKDFRYVETPQEGFLLPEDERLPKGAWGKPVRYGHGFFDKTHAPLYHFELYVLKDALLEGRWKRPPFRRTGSVFVPTFLETPYFRFDLGRVENNCDEAADIAYDVASPGKIRFDVTPRTDVTAIKLRLMKLAPNARYALEFGSKHTKPIHTQKAGSADADGVLVLTLPGAPLGSRAVIECVRLPDEHR